MSNSLRILLLIAAAATALWIFYQIRRLKIKLEHAIYWIVFAILLAVLGLFPELTYWLTGKLGVMSPANLIFLVIIFLLLLKVFTLSMLTSQMEDKITVLSAEIALRSHDAEHRLEAQEDRTGTAEEETERKEAAGEKANKEAKGKATTGEKAASAEKRHQRKKRRQKK